MRIQADTLSVLLTNSSSITMGVHFGKGHYTNLCVRFDQGDKATICGYGQEYYPHDQNVVQYDNDSPTAREHFEYEGNTFVFENQPDCVYVSAESEVKILKACLRGITRQLNDSMFTDSCTAEYRVECGIKILKAINALKEHFEGMPLSRE